jgi:hypothetical protein
MSRAAGVLDIVQGWCEKDDVQANAYWPGIIFEIGMRLFIRMIGFTTRELKSSLVTILMTA